MSAPEAGIEAGSEPGIEAGPELGIEAEAPMEALSEAIEHATRRRNRIRLGLAGLLLAAGVLASRFVDRSPDAPDRRAMGSVVFVDVEGWYARTPHEVAVASPFKLALDALPAGLPLNFGEWRGEDRRHDPEIDVWFRNPDVTIERTYRRADGEIVWLSAFGSRGEKSFHLFEHTPNLCYPLAGWRIDSLELAALPRGPRPLTVNLGRASGEEGGLVFLYLYVWDSPARAADEGVLSVRIAAPVRHETEATVTMLTEEFLTEIFPQTLTWSRF